MSYNYSYNVLINRFEAFAAGHFLIRRFTHGQIDMSDQLQDDQYPFMHVTPDTIEPVPGAMNFGFHVMFADIPRDKEYKAEYQREVISDCIRLGQDLIAEIKNGLELFGFDVQLLETPTFEPFMEEQKNTVTGIAFTIKLAVPWDWSACDIPAIWSVGGTSSTGGDGTGYGITLQTNGVDNVVQTLLNLVEGSNITITDNGNGSVTIDSAGGGGTSDYVSTAYNANHTTATGNQYVIGDRVWYNGNVYQCIANNDAIIPTNTSYWTLVSAGYRLRQTPVDWNATSGDFQILNKPTIPAAQVNADWNASSGLAEILNKPTIPAAQVNSDWNASSGIAQILNKPTLATVATTGSYTDLINQPSIPPAQVNSDWNASSGLAQILNKPTIPTTLDSLTDVNAPSPTNAQVLTYNTATSQWIAATPSGGGGSGTVTSVGTAGLISGGTITTSGTITTAMTTNKLVGRYTAGTGIMEEITVGSGLTLTGAGVLNNTATPTPTGYYGAWQDTSTQTAAASNVGYPMIFGSVDLENQVRMVSDGTNLTRITFDNTGIYNLNFSVQIQNIDNAEHDVTIWIRKNGMDVVGSAGYITVPKRRSTGAGLEGHTVAGWNYLLSVVAGEYYQIVWSTSNATNVTLQYYAAGSPPPSTASTLAIVTQQSGIMAGTGITAINSLTGAAQTITTGTTGTNFAVVSSGTTHTFNLPTASATNRGALSTADWSTFNGKQDALVSGTNIKTINSTSLLGSGNISIGSTTLLYQSQNATNIPASSTYFGCLFGGALSIVSTDTLRRTPIATGGTLTKLYVQTSSAQPATGSLVCTVRKNSVDQALTLTIAAGSAAGVFTDLVNSVSVAQGDLMGMKFQNNATAAVSANVLSNQVILSI
jgi:hypothetical protein